MQEKNQMMFLMIAGESSGDLLGGALAREIFRRSPECRIYGVGGNSMHAAGVELLQTIDNMGVTGFTEVVQKLGHILRVMKRIVEFARRTRPLAVVLIDYPDFNLRLAPRLKRIGIPVIYYVSPQLWAWRSYRVKTVRKYVDKMMTLLPFEETWYHERDIDAVFVGHPVIERVSCVPSRRECRLKHGFNDDHVVVAMLPGSRQNEVVRSLPVFIAAARKLKEKGTLSGQKDRKLVFVIPLADTISPDQIPGYPCLEKSDIRIVLDDTLSIVRSADVAWVTSGTAVLETALLGTPHIVVYKTSPLSYWLAKNLVHVKNVSLANLVVGEIMGKELIQNDFTPEKLVTETERVVMDDQ